MRRCIGCRAPIERPMIACRPCWQRLPAEIRERVKSLRPEHYIRGAVEAVAWFRENGTA